MPVGSSAYGQCRGVSQGAPDPAGNYCPAVLYSGRQQGYHHEASRAFRGMLPPIDDRWHLGLVALSFTARCHTRWLSWLACVGCVCR